MPRRGSRRPSNRTLTALNRFYAPDRCRGPDPILARRTACSVCGREARGFGWSSSTAAGHPPTHRFCSMACLQAWGTGDITMIDKTAAEKAALKAARRPLAETLTELGLMDPFFHRSAEDIDRIIETCVTGFQQALQAKLAAQSQQDDPLDDDIPF